jgi:hypothetical protein
LIELDFAAVDQVDPRPNRIVNMPDLRPKFNDMKGAKCRSLHGILGIYTGRLTRPFGPRKADVDSAGTSPVVDEPPEIEVSRSSET